MIQFEKLKQTVAYILSMFFAILFLYAAFTKLLDYRQFKAQLGEPTILIGYADTMAWMVPILELVISFLLFYGRFRLYALYGCLGLLILYTAYILVILNFSEVVPCSCGGVISALGWNDHIVLNMVLLSLAILAINSFKKKS